MRKELDEGVTVARKLPIGIQSFESIRMDGYVYVDKTAFVWKIVNEGKPYFLSRPRRFGKSLLLSTIKAYLEGRRDLFRGLAIERLEEDAATAADREPWQARPVFHLDFNAGDYTREGALEEAIESKLLDWGEAWGVTRRDGTQGQRFLRLMRTARERTGRRVAVLVDEYDKPLLECMNDPGLEKRNRATLKGFYGALKSADDDMRLAFLTGVTKFSKVSIFSDLNQLRDMSLDAACAGICGVTEAELTATFDPELARMARALGTDERGCLDALRAQYDGYCFDPGGPAHDRANMVYNPFSLLNALEGRRIGSYWFATGTPTFLVHKMRDSGLDPKGLVEDTIYIDEARIMDYRADDPDPVPLLYQTGYLTICGRDDVTGEFELGVPNGEVEWGLLQSLLPAYAPAYSRGTDVFALRRLAEAGDTEGIRDVLAALFASIPYTTAGGRGQDPFENYFQAVIWLTFTLLNRYVHTEVHQALGRADIVVEARAHVYVMELKRDGTAEEALAQIEAKDYTAPFAADPRELHVIGCAFDTATRTLSDWAEL